jgi:phosphoglycolate phosphatase
MLVTAMQDAGCGPDDTIMIGDTTYDIDMALAAGVRAIGVAWGYHPIEALAGAGAHALVHDADALKAELKAFTKMTEIPA